MQKLPKRKLRQVKILLLLKERRLRLQLRRLRPTLKLQENQLRKNLPQLPPRSVLFTEARRPEKMLPRSSLRRNQQPKRLKSPPQLRSQSLREKPKPPQPQRRRRRILQLKPPQLQKRLSQKMPRLSECLIQNLKIINPASADA